jgi:hypothetical protein
MDGPRFKDRPDSYFVNEYSQSILATVLSANGEVSPYLIESEYNRVNCCIKQGCYPFDGLFLECTRKPAREALDLCYRYFNRLTHESSLPIPAEYIGNFIVEFGLKALDENGSLAELETDATKIFSLIGGSIEVSMAVESIIEKIIPSPQFDVLRAMTRGCSDGEVFCSVVAAYAYSRELSSVVLFHVVSLYCQQQLEQSSSFPYVKDRISLVIARFGIEGINKCSTVQGFIDLAKAIQDLFAIQKESLGRITELLHPQHTSQQKLLLKIVNGITGVQLVTTVVAHTEDHKFSPREWDTIGNRCLITSLVPARLWLAVGANASHVHIIGGAAKALSNELQYLQWGHRERILLERLIDQASNHCYGAAASSLREKALALNWISPSASLWLLEMDPAPSANLLDTAVKLRNSGTLTERAALQLWSLGKIRGYLQSVNRGQWITLHQQIASRLPNTEYAEVVAEESLQSTPLDLV